MYIGNESLGTGTTIVEIGISFSTIQEGSN
jgi:hypothetical protein